MKTYNVILKLTDDENPVALERNEILDELFRIDTYGLDIEVVSFEEVLPDAPITDTDRLNYLEEHQKPTMINGEPEALTAAVVHHINLSLRETIDTLIHMEKIGADPQHDGPAEEKDV